MINILIALKAIADETRMELLSMLLQNNCCVRALARRLGLTEATVSGHLKILREAGFLTAEKRGHFKHYTVKREALRELSDELAALAEIKFTACTTEMIGCQSSERETCHAANCICGCSGSSV